LINFPSLTQNKICENLLTVYFITRRSFNCSISRYFNFYQDTICISSQFWGWKWARNEV